MSKRDREDGLDRASDVGRDAKRLKEEEEEEANGVREAGGDRVVGEVGAAGVGAAEGGRESKEMKAREKKSKHHKKKKSKRKKKKSKHKKKKSKHKKKKSKRKKKKAKRKHRKKEKKRKYTSSDSDSSSSDSSSSDSSSSDSDSDSDSQDSDTGYRPAKRKSSHALNQSNFGKFGIIRQSDFGGKRGEFEAWMREHKQIDPTSLRPSESKQYFSLFIEDYNTATMPSEKYYDLHAFERKRQVLEYQELMAKKSRDSKGSLTNSTGPVSSSATYHDEMAHRRQLQAKARRDKTAAAYRQLTSLNPEKV